MATFTPGIAIDPVTGEETISFDHGVYDSGEGRQAAIAHHMHTQHHQYVQDVDGRIHHEWSDLDPERYERFEPDFVDPDEYGTQFDEMEISENDQEYLQDIVGGSDAYNEIIAWAASALDPDDIANYDQIMESGDIGEMEEAVRWLYEQFSNADLSDDYSSNDEDSFVEQVYDVIPNYDDVTAWAYENLSEEAIAEFNSVIENGGTELQAQYIDNLVALYNEAE